MSNVNIYFGLTGLETDFQRMDLEGGYLQRLESRPNVSDIINAAADHEQGAQIAQYAGQIGYELMLSASTPEQALAQRGIALAFVKLLGLHTRSNIFVPVSSSVPWLSLRKAEKSSDLQLVHDFGQVYKRASGPEPPPIPLITMEQVKVARSFIATFLELDSAMPKFQLASIAYSDSELQQNDRMAAVMVWSGIEGILGINAELSFRISAILAFALYDSGNQREEFYYRIRKMYDVRSRIVHGDQLPTSQIIENYVSAREELRSILLAILDKGKVPTIKELEMAMLGESERSYFFSERADSVNSN